MGANVAPHKSYNPASTTQATDWLRDTWWKHIEDKLEAVKHFRYVGARLSTSSSTTTSTISKRWEKAMQQLSRLRYSLATIKAKKKTTAANTYVAAFYGTEAAAIATAKVAQLTVAVIGVFPFRNDTHTHTMQTFSSPRSPEVKRIWTHRPRFPQGELCKSGGPFAKERFSTWEPNESWPTMSHRASSSHPSGIMGSQHVKETVQIVFLHLKFILPLKGMIQNGI